VSGAADDIAVGRLTSSRGLGCPEGAEGVEPHPHSKNITTTTTDMPRIIYSQKHSAIYA